MSRPRRGAEAGFEFVYVNQDGSVRELSPSEQAYLSEKFAPTNGGRPYIKSWYRSTLWGSQSGFIKRNRIPSRVQILPVHPNYDAREKEFGYDLFGSYRATGDLIEHNADGSTTITPNPKLSGIRRFKRMRQYELAQVRERQSLAKVDD